MRLVELTLRDFKRFVEPVTITGFGPGLNVIDGPNERGKSTLLAALRAVLFERYASKSQAIVALRHDRNDTSPWVALVFETAAGRFRIEKQFLRGAYARLELPDGRRLEGGAAEDALQEALGFLPAGTRGATIDSLGAWGVLWVEQGQSFSLPPLSSTAREALQGALSAEVGQITGGRRARALTEKVEAALYELVTPGTGRPRKALKSAQDGLAALEARLRDLRARRDSFERLLADLPRLRTEVQRLTDPARESEAAARLEEARQRYAAAAALSRRLGEAEQTLGASRLAEERGHAAVLVRDRLIEEARTARETAAQAERRAAEAAGVADQAATRLKAAETARREAAEVSQETDQAFEAAIEEREAVRLAVTVGDLSARLDQARAAWRECRQARSDAEAVRLDERDVERLEQAERAVRESRAGLRAVALEVTFDLRPESVERVRVDGRAVAPDERLALLEASLLTIEGIGSIHLAPRIADAERLRAEARAAVVAYEGLRTRLQVENLDEARRLLSVRQGHREAARAAEQRLALLAPGRSPESAVSALEEELRPLRARLDRLRPSAGGPDAAPTLDHAEAALTEAERRRRAARERLAEAEAEAAVPRKRAEVTAAEALTARTRADDLAARAAALARDLAEAETAVPAAELRAAAQRCWAQVQAAEAAVRDLREARGPEDETVLDQRVRSCQAALDNLARERGRAREEMRAAEATLIARESEGLDEAVAEAEAELEIVRREAARLEREAQVLQLLRDELRKAEAQAQQRYLAPIGRRLARYLDVLFPGAELRLDENLSLVTLHRAGGHEEAVERLSEGTREQLAVLVRLAFGELLAEQGRPAAIVLDDALVFSDDDRIQALFDILALAGRKMQIVVLTCRRSLFLGIEATRPVWRQDA